MNTRGKPTKPSLINPLADEISSWVLEINQMDEDKRYQLERVAHEWDVKIKEAKDSLDEAMAKLAKNFNGGDVSGGKPDGRRKAKKKWKQIALAIQQEPDAGYHEVCRMIYGNITEAHIKTLRATMYQMRIGGAVEGEPGAWKLRHTPDEIEWLNSGMEEVEP
jgi:hypothetical protein